MKIQQVTKIISVLYFLSASVSVSAAEMVFWDSEEGMKRFTSAQAKKDFYPLANHFESQENKVYCGVASAVIILNALRLDNPAIQKPLDSAALTPEERRYFPKNFTPLFERYSQHNLLVNSPKDKMEILGKPVTVQGKTLSDYGLQLQQMVDLLKKHKLEVTKRVANAQLDDATIKKELIQNMQTANDYVMINYSRKTFGMENVGHNSPLAAYDQASDSFLIMDVNPNSSKWAWVKTADLIASMRTFDTVENRGYLLIKDTYHTK